MPGNGPNCSNYYTKNHRYEATDSVQVKEPSKTVFGAVNSPTPAWANWAFRGVFILNKVLTAWLTATHLISDGNKYEVLLAFTALDTLAWGVSRLLGVVPDTDQK